MKENFKTSCECRQSSFDYHGKENALIGKKGNFEVKNINIFGNYNRIRAFKEIGLYPLAPHPP